MCICNSDEEIRREKNAPRQRTYSESDLILFRFTLRAARAHGLQLSHHSGFTDLTVNTCELIGVLERGANTVQR